jgi:hypothetical protein
MKKDVIKIVLVIVAIILCVLFYDKINNNEIIEIAYL